MAKVQIGFGAILGDVHLTVLIGAHGARVNVNIGVELEESDLEPARLEDGSQRRGGDAFAQRGHDTAGHKDKFGHFGPFSWS